MTHGLFTTPVLLTAGLLLACVCIDANLGGIQEDKQTCQELGLQGECVETHDCVCLCYTVTAKGTSVEAAYFGELGYELLLYSPSIYYLHMLGSLRKTIGPSGSAAYNYFSPNHTELPSPRRWCPGTYTHHYAHRVPFDYSSWHPAPYKKHFKKNKLKFEKPLVIVHNKYAREWSDPPVNFIDIPTLMQLAEYLKSHYTVVYIRPTPHLEGYSVDGNEMLHFNDHEELRRVHPEVLFFHELMERYHEHDFNNLQLRLHATCDYFISVQGGNSVIASYFAGTNVIYAVKGHEIETDLAYKELYPRLAVDPRKSVVQHVRTYDELLTFVRQHF
ncbi:hypothetical protein ABBQ38_000706 [Trebouxia sp. C0009 RCD-2024]